MVNAGCSTQRDCGVGIMRHALVGVVRAVLKLHVTVGVPILAKQDNPFFIDTDSVV